MAAGNWNNGLPSKANADIATIAHLEGTTALNGTVSAKRLVLTAGVIADLTAVTLDIDELQIGAAGKVYYCNLDAKTLLKLRNYRGAKLNP
jgi:hypothetical protein